MKVNLREKIIWGIGQNGDDMRNGFYVEDIKEFIRDIPNGIKKCIEKGQFNERYFEQWLKERVGELNE